jgi:beta-xylosidase
MIIGDGFGDISNIKIESLLVHDDILYDVTFKPQTGLQIWRSEDAINWEQIISNGFGDSNNFSTLWNNAFTEFKGHIVIGTWNNVGGGELWMSTP